MQNNEPTGIVVYMYSSPIVHNRVDNRAILQCIIIANDRNVTWRTLNALRLEINDVLKTTKDYS
jgi:2-phospho-L-lactate guanylyltransferase (CobY/MobA/RfbA family)